MKAEGATGTPASDLPTISVWAIGLDRQFGDEEGLAESLSSDEHSRARSFRHQADQRRYTVTRAALRDVLGDRLDRPPASLCFEYSTHGKPELLSDQNGADLRFNVSHSGDVALIVVTTGVRIGVDVERVRPLQGLDAIISRFFSVEEIDALSTLPVDERLNGFFACWTRKEAFVKATGVGLSTPLAQFAVTVGPQDDPEILHIKGDREAARLWSLRDLATRSGYFGTLAVEASDWHFVESDWAPR